MTSWGSWTGALVLGGLASLAAGCATGQAMGVDRSNGRGLRGSIVVSGAEARSALVGPLHLLHVDYETRGTVELYSVARRAGTDADCAGPTLMRLSLHGRRPNPIDADVGANEVVCLVAETDTRTGNTTETTTETVSISWHGTPRDPEAPRSLAAAFPLGR